MAEKIYNFSVRDEFIPFNGGFTIHHVYLDDGTESFEVIRSFDCGQHLLTKDRKRHFCLSANPDGKARICAIGAEHVCNNCCNHVCEVKKELYRTHLLRYPVDDSAARYFKAYIKKPNDTPFDQTAAAEIMKGIWNPVPSECVQKEG